VEKEKVEEKPSAGENAQEWRHPEIWEYTKDGTKKLRSIKTAILHLVSGRATSVSISSAYTGWGWYHAKLKDPLDPCKGVTAIRVDERGVEDYEMSLAGLAWLYKSELKQFKEYVNWKNRGSQAAE